MAFFGIFVFVLGPEIIFPAMELTIIAFGLSIATVVFGLLAKHYKSRELKLIMLLLVFLIMFIWSLHAVKYLLDSFWLIAFLLFAGLILIGLFPKLYKELATRAFDETMSPKTVVGKLLMKVILPVILIVTLIGVPLDVFGKEPPASNRSLQWFMAIIMYLCTAGFIFYIMHDFYKNKPFVWSYGEIKKNGNIKSDKRNGKMFQKMRDKRIIENSYRKGVSNMQSGRPDLAVDEFSKVLDIQPDFMEARLARGICLATVASNDKALEDLNVSLKVDPSIKAAYYWLGVIYLRKRELDLALENADKAIELNPGEPANYLLRGGIYLEKGNFQTAIDNMNAAIEHGFEKDGYNNRALVYEKMGKEDLAIADWSEVIRLAPKQPKAYLKRGLLYTKTGNKKDAVSDLQIGLKDHRLVENGLYIEASEALKSIKEVIGSK